MPVLREMGSIMKTSSSHDRQYASALIARKKETGDVQAFGTARQGSEWDPGFYDLVHT